RPFSEFDCVVGKAAWERLFCAVGPEYFDRFEGCGRGKPEVHTGIVAAQVTESRIREPPITLSVGMHHQFGAVRVAAAERRVGDAHWQPMAGARRDIPIKLRWSAGAGDEQIQVAVVVDIADG